MISVNKTMTMSGFYFSFKGKTKNEIVNILEGKYSYSFKKDCLIISTKKIFYKQKISVVFNDDKASIIIVEKTSAFIFARYTVIGSKI